MSRRIVVTSGKGGVGKTSVAANLGAKLSRAGHRVCLCDLDIGLNNLDVVCGIENRIVYDLIDVIDGAVPACPRRWWRWITIPTSACCPRRTCRTRAALPDRTCGRSPTSWPPCATCHHRLSSRHRAGLPPGGLGRGGGRGGHHPAHLLGAGRRPGDLPAAVLCPGRGVSGGQPGQGRSDDVRGHDEPGGDRRHLKAPPAGGHPRGRRPFPCPPPAGAWSATAGPPIWPSTCWPTI